jgi:hypothetical protein
MIRTSNSGQKEADVHSADFQDTPRHPTRTATWSRGAKRSSGLSAPVATAGTRWGRWRGYRSWRWGRRWRRRRWFHGWAPDAITVELSSLTALPRRTSTTTVGRIIPPITGTTAAGRSATSAALTVVFGFAIDPFACGMLARQPLLGGLTASDRRIERNDGSHLLEQARSANAGCYLSDFNFFLRCARVRSRSAFSRMNPSASRWS